MEFGATDRDGVWPGLTVTFFVSEIDLVYKWFKMNNLRKNPILNAMPLPAIFETVEVLRRPFITDQKIIMEISSQPRLGDENRQVIKEDK